MQTFVFYILLTLSAVGWFGFTFLFCWYWMRERREQTRLRQTKADIADIMLLFQTMRDVVMQQKQLANDFNAELERKVGGVKQVLASAIEKNERLYERQRFIEQKLDDTRAELESLQKQVSFLSPVVKEQPHHRAAAESHARPASAPFVALPDGADDAASPPHRASHVAPISEQPEADQSAAASLWEQVDMAALSDNSLLGGEDELEEEMNMMPADGDGAREAFRALLDLTANGNEHGGSPAPAGDNKDAIRQRVLQYAEAGMDAADIARELGIGKGEVRLMLNLAKPGQG